MPTGRPTKYRASRCAEVRALGLEGKSRVQIAAALGIGRATMHAWAEAHPEFRQALDEARDLSQAWWEDLGQRAALGLVKDFAGAPWIFQMKNRFPAEYRDRHEHDVTGSMTVAATIDRPPRESREEWLKRREAELGASVGGAARPPG